jgi:gelsolin
MAYQVKLEDSNMANYGSKEHRDMRKDAAKKEKAWENAGKEVGVQIWRIEKFQVKNWQKDRYGEFYSGDSYIILHTMVNDEGKKTYDVFFWLGTGTTQDEAGTAAYKTVELDDLLGDEPVQYREVQGNETKKFLDLFPKITILDGGVDSGFRHVKPEDYKPRLLHISGYQKHVQVSQVPLKIESLNDSDTFVLDAGLKIWQFNGTKSNGWEKRKANAIVDELTASRNGKVQKSYIIDGLKDKGSPLIEEFWNFFGGRPNQIKDEAEVKEAPEVELSLHHISDASGVMEIKEVSRGKLDKSKLNSDDAFIVDAGGQVFVWIGKNSTKNEKREAMAYAVRYLGEQGRSADVPICRIIDGQETPEFWAAFAGKSVGGRATQMKEWKK